MPAGLNCWVEPLSTSHDRSSFSSGVQELDDYLHLRAGQDFRRNVATPFVLVDGRASILGYYTLSSHTVRLAALPESLSRRLPRYPLLPATLLGRLAVSQLYRGRKLGSFLLMDALHRTLRSTRHVASVGLVVDALDDSARNFYLHHEFVPLLDHPDRLFLAMGTIEKLFRSE